VPRVRWLEPRLRGRTAYYELAAIFLNDHGVNPDRLSEKERQNKMHKFLEACQAHGAVAPAPAARRGFEVARGKAVVVCTLPGAEVLIVAEEDHPDAKHGNSGRCHSFVKLVRSKHRPA
jgi:hypothetical protein